MRKIGKFKQAPPKKLGNAQKKGCFIFCAGFPNRTLGEAYELDGNPKEKTVTWSPPELS